MSTKGTQSWHERLYRLMDSVRVNNISNSYALSVIDDITARARVGEVYHFSHYFEEIGDGGNADLLVQTGANLITIRVSLSAQKRTLYRAYEGTTITDPGSAVLETPRNRNTDFTFTSTVTHTPTVDTIGTNFAVDLVPAGQQNSASGGIGNDLAVWVLKPNTNYLLRATNISGGSGGGSDTLIAGDIFEDIL